MNVIDLLERADMTGISLEKDEEWEEMMWVAWEKFIEIIFKEKEYLKLEIKRLCD